MSEHIANTEGHGTELPVAGDPDPLEAAASGGKLSLGWREWVGLPSLGLPAIKAKIDTGARTSALHAYDIAEEVGADGELYVNFSTQPIQRNETLEIRCRARVVDKRRVTDSGGHTADRYVISTRLVLGERQRDVEVTLTDRRGMLFRLLVGRTSLLPDVVVDPSSAFLLGKQSVRDHYPNVPIEAQDPS